MQSCPADHDLSSSRSSLGVACAGSTPPVTLPGYELVERIGTGGYGEVWKAVAPGGLLKAVKLVFGRMDDARANRELKALERMKQVRHPFLLSLERFDVVDGLLMIVSELADGSLKDRFEACRASALPGIPRDELLGYLRDASDALDYLSENHGLQHLDVKPENLLLVGGRLKVADFGLVKGLGDIETSMMAGLTPVYAPPEVFDGHPHSRSDQYSLAIVFYHMLTGSLPFAGRTAAQLAAQHLYSRPMLAMLPAADQPIIARALTKDPEGRYQGCRALVNALTAAGAQPQSETPTTTRPSPIAAAMAKVANAPQTASITRTMSASTNELRDVLAAAPSDSAAYEPLPPLENLDPHPAVRPTVFIGLGGLGASVLRGMRQRLNDRFGGCGKAPSLAMLLVDTNMREINEATSGDTDTALAPPETLLAPLRASGEYRDNVRHLTGWINRRWLFNVPRSQQTEGLRPLGRLALVDHGQQVTQAVSRVLATAVSSESREASQSHTGLQFPDIPPRVFVVAATSGGTGSGMVLDVAQLARKLLRDAGHDDNVCVILAHSTDRKAATRDLGLANTAACLLELRHINRAGGQYPGEPALGIPPLAGEDATLSNAYFVHLGNDLGEEQLHSAADRIADYLYRNTVTPAAAFFDAARKALADDDKCATAGMVRSFGISSIGFASGDVPGWSIDALCGIFVDHWRGTTAIDPPMADEDDDLGRSTARHAASSKLQALAQQQGGELASRLGFSFESLIEHVESVARGIIAATPGADPAIPPVREDVLEHVTRKLEEPLGALAVRQAAEVREWLADQLATAPARLQSAQWGGSWLMEHLSVLRKRIAEGLAWLRERDRELTDALSSGQPAADTPEEPRRGSGRSVEAEDLQSQAHGVRWQLALFSAAGRFVGSLHAATTGMFGELVDLGRDLELLRKTFAATRSEAGDAGARNRLMTSLKERWKQMTAFMESQVEAMLLAPGVSLRRVSRLSPAQLNALPTTLRRAARQSLVQAMRNCGQAARDAAETERNSPLPVSAAENAFATLPIDAGEGRLLLCSNSAATAASWGQELAEGRNQQATVVIDVDNDPAVCFEVGGIPLRRLVRTLVGQRPELLDAAEKLHTRTDTPWCGL